MRRVGNGEVLVKVHCAPIHPEDLEEVEWEKVIGIEEERIGRGIGIEGSGVVG